MIDRLTQKSRSTRNFAGPVRIMLTVSAVVFAVGCGGGGGSNAGTPENTGSPATQNDQIRVEDVRDRVIAWYPIGILGKDSDTRNVRTPLVESGWEDSGFIDGVLGQLKANDRGLHRVMLHTPFGRESPVQFDGYLEALEIDELDKVTGGFVDAWWSNVTNPSLGLDIEVIAYNGSPWLDPDSQRVLDEQGEEAFFDRAWKAISPFLDANMAIAFDAAAPVEKESITYRFAQMVKDRGAKVYIEANPEADHTWWFDHPVIVLEETWQERKDDPKFAPRNELQREVIRIVRVVHNGWTQNHGPREWPQAACRVIAEGDTLAVSDALLREPERNLEDLTACANRHREQAQD